MAIFYYQKKSEFFPVYLSLILSLLLALGGTAAFFNSVLNLKRASMAVDSLLQGGILDSEEIHFLENLKGKTETLLFRHYREPEIMAAALLLHDQKEDDLAGFFLLHMDRRDTALSLMGRNLLLEICFDRQDWISAAEYSAHRILSGEKDPQLLSYYFKAVWMGGLSLSPGISPDISISWSIPFLYKQGRLSRQQYYRYLLEEDLLLINEIQSRWSSSYDTDRGAADILNLRMLLDQKEYPQAEPLLNDIWTESLGQMPGLPENFLLEMRTVILRSGRDSSWLKTLEDSLQSKSAGFAGAFLMASLYEEAGKTDAALSSYRMARSLAGGRSEGLRAQWYELRLLIREDREEVPGFLKNVIASWGSSDYF